MSDEIVLNPDFWDCECETNYIHSKQLDECPVCHAWQEEQPDSIQNEVEKFFSDTQADLIASGYEWICPACSHFNKVIEWLPSVTCSKCHNTFDSNIPEHAIG